MYKFGYRDYCIYYMYILVSKLGYDTKILYEAGILYKALSCMKILFIKGWVISIEGCSIQFAISRSLFSSLYASNDLRNQHYCTLLLWKIFNSKLNSFKVNIKVLPKCQGAIPFLLWKTFPSAWVLSEKVPFICSFFPIYEIKMKVNTESQ